MILAKRHISEQRQQLEEALLRWYAEEEEDWDTAIGDGSAESLPGGVDLWDSMPVFDSKAVARTSAVFEEHLGVPLDTSLIQPGGYRGVDHMIKHLVPAMLALADKKGAVDE